MDNSGRPHLLRTPPLFAIVVLLFLASLIEPAEAQAGASAIKPVPRQVERGKYLARIAGCNDCHTAGYAETGGQVPESEWLLGTKLGWQGPWGTTYPINLRLFMQKKSEDQWVQFAKTQQSRPPMPWFALRDMTEADLRAIYHFVRFLGPAGEPAPAYVPPGKEAPSPYVKFPAPPP